MGRPVLFLELLEPPADPRTHCHNQSSHWYLPVHCLFTGLVDHGMGEVHGAAPTGTVAAAAPTPPSVQRQNLRSTAIIRWYLGSSLTPAAYSGRALEVAGIEFIDENGGVPRLRL
jgi:hypothetical protein